MDTSCLALAAKYVRRQAKQLEDQLDGVCRAEDIECVHRARVASRRLRTALRMFRDCFPRKQLKRWRKHLRRVAADLGHARDRDVQIEFLCRALETADQPGYYPGVARLLVDFERQRELLQSDVVKATRRLRRSSVLKEMQGVAKRILGGLSAEELAAQQNTGRGLTARHIRRRLDRMLRCQDSLLDAEAKQQHHDMRIAAKRLRYTLEIANPIYERRLAPFIESAKKVQTLLGHVHDCDVWLEQLDAFARAERQAILAHFGTEAPLARLETGIEYLRQDRRTHRQATFRELVEYWDDLQQRQHWDSLPCLLEAPAPATSTAQPATSTASTAQPAVPATALAGAQPKPPSPEAANGAQEPGESSSPVPRPPLEQFANVPHPPNGTPHGTVREAFR